LIRGGIALAVAALAGCGSFEDPEIVIDLRALAMVAEPPEIVADVDPEDPGAVELDDIDDVTVCALVADPTEARRLEWTMTACPPTDGGRCDEPDDPSTVIGEGIIEDPETGDAAPSMCGTLGADGNLIAILMESVRADDLLGFGGISAQVELRVAGEGGAEPIFATKRVRYAPRIPADRVANSNPSLESFAVTMPGGEEIALPIGRCRDIEPLTVGPGAEITIEPVEPEGAREEYVLPTIDGGRVELTENLRYQWLATGGDWRRFESGGPVDPFGNEPLLDTRWTSPEDAGEVEMWVVQRDERGGSSFYRSCVRVEP
jgi:hypothetical protein